MYIAEAHPTDEWQVSDNEEERVLLEQHKSMDERRAAAVRLTEEMKLSLPILIDAMDDAASAAFAAWPERIFIVAGQALAYCGGPGPYEFDVAAPRKTLEGLIASREPRPGS